MYLRLLGAKIGKHCSIRAINPVSDPQLISIGAGVHIGDFSRIIAGFYSSSAFTSGEIEVHDNSIIGSQSLILPGSVVQNDVILGALSIAPMNSVLRKGGVYIGSQTPVMIKNTMHGLDERIEEMDLKYKKIVGNLAANLAATTLKVKTRYFHRISVSGKGFLKIYDNIKGLPNHKIFCPGKSYPVIVRHSNSLSADDDARIDARGAAVRILSDESGGHSPLLDLTLKTGRAFYARTIADFATWLVCGLAAREEHVKRVPHVRDAV
jgi:carbonic anhydrase/acetyltransferase-like protein (isoleucine patch superfamily)